MPADARSFTYEYVLISTILSSLNNGMMIFISTPLLAAVTNADRTASLGMKYGDSM